LAPGEPLAADYSDWGQIVCILNRLGSDFLYAWVQTFRMRTRTRFMNLEIFLKQEPTPVSINPPFGSRVSGELLPKRTCGYPKKRGEFRNSSLDLLRFNRTTICGTVLRRKIRMLACCLSCSQLFEISSTVVWSRAKLRKLLNRWRRQIGVPKSLGNF